jgi:hypothetical protein
MWRWASVHSVPFSAVAAVRNRHGFHFALVEQLALAQGLCVWTLDHDLKQWSIGAILRIAHRSERAEAFTSTQGSDKKIKWRRNDEA